MDEDSVKENIAMVLDTARDFNNYLEYRESIAAGGGYAGYLAHMVELADAFSAYEAANPELYEDMDYDWYELSEYIVSARMNDASLSAEDAVALGVTNYEVERLAK